MIEPEPIVVKPQQKEPRKPFFSDPGRTQDLRKLTIANPMQMEVVRFKRKFLSVTPSIKLNRMMAAIVGLIYLLILGLAFTGRHDAIPEVILDFQLAVTIFVGILGAHSVISGERERRSWDLLQAAPITQHQIVVGKFQSIAMLIGVVQLIAVPFVIIANVFGPHPMALLPLISLEVMCFGVSAFWTALTVYLSSRLRTSNSALVAGMSLAVTAYGVIPMLIYTLLSPDQHQAEKLMYYFHPFYHVYGLVIGATNTLNILALAFAYLGLSGFLLAHTGTMLAKARQGASYRGIAGDFLKKGRKKNSKAGEPKN